MDKANITDNGGHEGCCSHWHKMGHGKWFVVVCILALIFVVSATLAIQHERRGWAGGCFGRGENGSELKQERDSRGMMGLRGWNRSRMSQNLIPGRGGMMTNGLVANDASSTSVFGSLSKVEGNKLTIADNGGKEQVIMSQSDTVITSTTGETTLSALKPGMIVNASGDKNADGSLNAKFIEVR